jgi:hypothetical protein
MWDNSWVDSNALAWARNHLVRCYACAVIYRKTRLTHGSDNSEPGGATRPNASQRAWGSYPRWLRGGEPATALRA